MFEFVSHESYPEDKYITEAVTLSLEGKYRVTYVRRVMQTGGRFWSEMAVAVTEYGSKKYLKSFSCDSSFLRDDIIKFLNDRVWEKGGSHVRSNEDVPF